MTLEVKQYYILVCDCSGQREKAMQAYEILPIPKHQPYPQVVKGKNNIALLAHNLKNDHIRSISKLNGRFAYYLAYDPIEKQIVEEYDLTTGRRVA